MKNTSDPKPLFRASYKLKGKEIEGAAYEQESFAEQDCQAAVLAGATFACILRDSQGADHPDNAGKFFLHRYIKA